MNTFRAKSELAFVYQTVGDDDIYKFKCSADERREHLESPGRMDCWSAWQRNILPLIDDSLIGFHVEMLFQDNAEE